MIINFQVDEAKERKRILNDNEENPTKKIKKLTSNQIKKGQGKSDDNNNESASKEENEARKKRRTRLWIPELQQRFIEAFSELGFRRSNFLLMTY